MKRQMRIRLLAIVLVILAGLGTFVALKGPFAPQSKAATATRNVKDWPFSKDSPWNTPIGSSAKYVRADIQPAENTLDDPNWVVYTKDSDPIVPLKLAGSFGPGRCNPGQQTIENIHFPNNFIVPDATGGSTPNNAAVIVLPDGHTIIQVEPLARCEAGGPVYGYVAGGWFSRQDLKDKGLIGGHFGSGLSSIGGSLRKGELLGNAPIHHALQIELWETHYDYYSAERPGFRWPASMADSGAKDRYCTADPCKSNHNAALVAGSLLAIPPSVTPESLGLQTNVGKKLFAAMRDFGGYNVDATGWDNNSLGMDVGVRDEIKQAAGIDMNDRGSLHDDINKLFQALQVVDNNSPDNVGGGGTPRASLALPFDDEGTGGTTPTPVPTQGATPTPTPVGSGTLSLNNAGISSDEDVSKGNLDGATNSYSANALKSAGITPGGKITYRGVHFTLPDVKPGQLDNYRTGSAAKSDATDGIVAEQLNGNSVALPLSGNAKAIALLGCSTNGPSQGDMQVTFTDGSKQVFKFGLTDWTRNAGKSKLSYGNKVVARMGYRNTAKGREGREVVDTYLFYTEIAIPAGKQVKSITLPTSADQGHIHVFAVSTR